MTAPRLNTLGRTLLDLPGDERDYPRDALVELHRRGLIISIFPGWIELTAKGARLRVRLMRVLGLMGGPTKR